MYFLKKDFFYIRSGSQQSISNHKLVHELVDNLVDELVDDAFTSDTQQSRDSVYPTFQPGDDAAEFQLWKWNVNVKRNSQGSPEEAGDRNVEAKFGLASLGDIVRFHQGRFRCVQEILPSS